MSSVQTSFTFLDDSPPAAAVRPPLFQELRDFREFGRQTIETATRATYAGQPVAVPTMVNEFWTAKQRAAHSLHEISYRACFKPQLPRFFIERLTRPGDTVYDPFMGRGTTLLEAALMGRVPAGCDVNPLSAMLVRPRLHPPIGEAVRARLAEIPFDQDAEFPEDLLTFYHPDTLRHICGLKCYLSSREQNGAFDHTDDWLRMVAVNRLTGHSPGFFSVYTMPPNQAVSVEAQKKINAARNQTPPLRNVADLILRKTRSLLSDCDERTLHTLATIADKTHILSHSSANVPELDSGSVSLVVTSPPFLDVVNYAQDNWLRCWFCGIDPQAVPLTVVKGLDEWSAAMTAVFVELARLLRPGGHVAFEVGEVRNGKLRLEEAVVPCGIAAGLTPMLVLINDQEFTKTAQCWGVDNMRKGTNTNRIVLFRK